MLTYSKREQEVYFIFSRGVFRALPRTSKMNLFEKIVNDFQSLIIFAKASFWKFDKVL